MEVVWLINFPCVSHVVLFKTGTELNSLLDEDVWQSKFVMSAIFIIIADPEDGESRFLLKVGACLPVCMVL
jgi:hypothetical protein